MALERAYATNAFADHYLTDMFSAGHVRTPRKALADHVTPSEVGSYLARYMHDEDSSFGLRVSSKDGQWTAYGDKRYFDAIDAGNADRVKAAVQRSVDEVFVAFAEGSVAAVTKFRALESAPNRPAPSEYDRDRSNRASLFSWDGKTLRRRKKINKLDDYEWTSWWAGFTTLADLKLRYGPRNG